MFVACRGAQLVSELVSTTLYSSTGVPNLNSIRHVLTELGAEGGIRSLRMPVRATACQPNVNGPVPLLNQCPEMLANASVLLLKLLLKCWIIASRGETGIKLRMLANTVTQSGS
jgi:hypothetical protein